MVMKALREGAAGGITKTILFGLLVLAVAGLMLTDVGGFFRGGVTSTDVARIGDESIKIAEFDNTVRRNLTRVGISPQEAYQLGYLTQLLASEIQGRVLSHAARDLGIIIGQDTVADHIKKLVAPMTGPDQSPKDVLVQLLQAQGIPQRTFFASIGRDLSNGILSQAISASSEFVDPATAADLYRYEKEKRTIDYIVFSNDKIEFKAAPQDGELETLYELVKESYAVPEKRSITVAIADLNHLKDTLDISEDELRAEYNGNIESYTQPERWILEQVLLTSEDQANAIVAAAKDSKLSLEKATKKITGNTTAYLGENTFAAANIPESLKDVLADPDLKQAKDKVIGPISSPIGFNILRIKSFEEESVKPFEDIAATLKDELLQERLLDQKYAIADSIDDLIASGASLEETQSVIAMKTVAINNLSLMGTTEGEEKLDQFEPDMASSILDAAFNLETTGETSSILETQDGGMFLVHLNTITPKSYPPFEDIKKSVRKRWEGDQKRLANTQRVNDIYKTIQTEQTPLRDFAKAEKLKVETLEDLERNGLAPSPFVPQNITEMFSASPDGVFKLTTDSGYALAQVKTIQWPEIENDSSEFQEYKQQLRSALGQDSVAAYIAHKNKHYGTVINQALLNQVYGQ